MFPEAKPTPASGRVRGSGRQEPSFVAADAAFLLRASFNYPAPGESVHPHTQLAFLSEEFGIVQTLRISCVY